MSTDQLTPPAHGSTTARDGNDSLPRRQVVQLNRRDLPEQSYFVYVPGTGGLEAPLFVAVHGVSRKADELAALFSDFCESRGVVLVAPLFTVDSADYQRLGRPGRGPRSDAALDAILEEVVELTGAIANPIHLFGHAAGAQFVHRYAMAHPHRVARVVMLGAGWYTFPKAGRRYPHGIRHSRDLGDVRFHPEDFLRVPMTVMVGENDSGENLRRTSRLDRQQGKTRIERGMKWVNSMRRAAEKRGIEPRVIFESIPAGDSSLKTLMDSAGLGERVFGALFEVASSNSNRA